MASTVIALFDNRQDVENAIDDLKSEGFNPKDISIAMKDTREAESVAEETGAGAVQGAASGATTGAILGGLAGLLASTVIPGLGALFIGGPLAAALGLSGAAATTVSGAATGAVAGGLVGALTGMGISRDDAVRYESRVKEGGILVAVPTEGEGSRVETILRNYNASDIRTVTS